MTIKSASTLVAEALKEIKTISPEEALEKLNNDTCNLIDIRDVRELERLGRIEKSSHIPRGMLEFWMDPDSQYFKEGKIDMNKEIVLFCAGGLRSALATKTLILRNLNIFTPFKYAFTSGIPEPAANGSNIHIPPAIKAKNTLIIK